MTREDIYFMAKQAGIDSVQQYDSDTSPIVLLERFAKLVAEHEREECAKVCEKLEAWDESYYAEFSRAPDCADAIRARKQA